MTVQTAKREKKMPVLIIKMGLASSHATFFKYTYAVAPSMTAEPTRSKNISMSSMK